MSIKIGFLLFQGMTPLDFVGPYEVLSRIPDGEVFLVSGNIDPVITEMGLAVLPTTTYEDCPQLDVIFVPGGPTVDQQIKDASFIAFLKKQAEKAKYITSVCTGSLILGAAGLLRGYRATSHWSAFGFLKAFGAIPVKERYVLDRNRMTGGGVTAGIDFGLYLVKELAGEKVAKTIQLWLEYDPHPPFDCGHPDKAEPSVFSALKSVIGKQATRYL